MLTSFLNASKRLSRLQKLSFIRNYCQNSREHELIAVLNGIGNWEPCKSVLTEKKFQLIQEWKVQNGGSIGSFDDIAKIKGMNNKIIEHLRKFCESQLQSEMQRDTTVSPPQILTPEYQDIDYEIFSKSHDSNSFVMYDVEIPPLELNEEQIIKPTPLRLHNAYSENGAKNHKALKLTLEPKFSNFSSIRSFTSIYQDATAITCTRFSTNGDWANDIKIDSWNYHKVQTINAKNLCQICDQLSDIVEQLSPSDIYIMDDHIKAQHFRKAILPKKLTEIVQINQQCAILVALLHKRNPNAKEYIESKHPNVFFMGYNTVGRLYNLFVGHEPASNQSIIKSILHNNGRTESTEPLKLDVAKNIKDTYFKSYPVERECLGKAMLIGLTFIRLGILKANV